MSPINTIYGRFSVSNIVNLNRSKTLGGVYTDHILYKEFYKKNLPIVVSHLRRFEMIKKEDLEDFIQDIYIEAYHVWEKLKDKNTNAPWLLTIARRKLGLSDELFHEGCFSLVKSVLFRKRQENALFNAEPQNLLCRDLEKFDLDEDFAERVWKKIELDLPTEKKSDFKIRKPFSWKSSVVFVSAVAVLMGIIMNFNELQQSLKTLSQGSPFFDKMLDLQLATIDQNKFPTSIDKNMKVSLGQPIIFYIEVSGVLPEDGIPINLSVTLPNGNEVNILDSYVVTEVQESLKRDGKYIEYIPPMEGYYKFNLIQSQVKDAKEKVYEKGGQIMSPFEIEIVRP